MTHKKVDIAKVEKEILVELSKNDGTTLNKIAEHIGHDWRFLRLAMSNLISREEVRIETYGDKTFTHSFYHLSEKGKKKSMEVD